MTVVVLSLSLEGQCLRMQGERKAILYLLKDCVLSLFLLGIST